MKKIFYIIAGLCILLLPLKANALSGSVNLSCGTTSLAPGASTKCTIKGNTTEGVSAVSIKLNVGENLTLTDVITDSTWEGDGEGGNIELYTDTNKSGNFAIATFNVKAGTVNTGVNTNITLSNVVLSDANFEETNFTVNPLSIRIPSTIDTLSSLTVDGAIITDFNSDKLNYSMTINNNKNSINIVANPTSEFSKVSGDIGIKSVKYGNNSYNIKVTSESGTVKNYSITVIKPEVRELNSLKINGEKISLKSGTYTYSINVNNDVTTADVVASLVNSGNAKFVDNYDSRKVTDLKVGNNEILVKVTDANNEELTYKVIVNRLEK